MDLMDVFLSLGFAPWIMHWKSNKIIGARILMMYD
jgi:hypothetical protein